MDGKTIKVIGIGGSKGRVGKSSFAINLAESLSLTNQRVLLIDADFNLANIHMLLGQTPEKTIYDVLKGNSDIQDTLLQGPSEVMVLPGVRNTPEIQEDNSGETWLSSLIQAVDSMENKIDVLLIDTAGGFLNRDLRLMATSNEAMILVTPDRVTISDTADYIIKLRTEYGVQNFNIVANMVQSQREGHQLMKDLQNQVGYEHDLVLHCTGILPYDNAMRKSCDQSRTLSQNHSESKVCKNIKTIAQSLNNSMTELNSRGDISFFFESQILAGAR